MCGRTDAFEQDGEGDDHRLGEGVGGGLFSPNSAKIQFVPPSGRCEIDTRFDDCITPAIASPNNSANGVTLILEHASNR